MNIVVLNDGTKVSHPGFLILEDMKYNNISEEKVAKALDVPLTTLKMLLNGDIDITQTLACKLAKVFKTSPNFYINAQNAFNYMTYNDVVINNFYSSSN